MIDEVRTILIEGGAVEPIRIDQDVNGWLVSAFFGPVQHLGHTGIDKNTSNDPRDMARRLVAIANTAAAAPEPDQVAEITPITDIREAYEDSHADDESPAEVGASEPADDDAGDVGVDGGDSSGDYLAEEAADSPPDDPDPSDAVDEPDPAQLGGVLIRELGDALTTAKAIALMAVDDERFQRVGDYDKAANQARLDELRAIQQAIREGVHPAFTDEQTEELQALETFLPFIQRIDDYAQGLRDAIREAGDLEVLTSIDIISGWPE